MGSCQQSHQRLRQIIGTALLSAVTLSIASLALAADDAPPEILRFGDEPLQPIRPADAVPLSVPQVGGAIPSASIGSGDATLQIVGSGNQVRFLQPDRRVARSSPTVVSAGDDKPRDRSAITDANNPATQRPTPKVVTMPTSSPQVSKKESRFAQFYKTKQSSAAAPSAPVPSVIASAPSIDARLAAGLERAGQLEKRTQWDKARGVYEQLVADFPSRYEPYHRLGLLADRQGRHKKAETWYIQALQYRPNDAGLLNNLGYCRTQQGNLTGADRVLRKAIRLDDSKALYHNNLGIVYGKQAKFRQALDCFRQGGTEVNAARNLEFVLASSRLATSEQARIKRLLLADPSSDRTTSALVSHQATSEGPASIATPIARESDDEAGSDSKAARSEREVVPVMEARKAPVDSDALARKAAALRAEASRMIDSRLSRHFE